MELFREIIGSVADIARLKIESEARLLKQNTLKLFTVCCMLAIGLVIFLTGLGFVLAALFIIIAKAAGTDIAALWIGAGLIVLSIILLVIVKTLSK